MEREEYDVLLYRLIKRFDNCYDGYIKEIMDLDKGQIIEAASEIIAVKEAYVEMCFWLVLSMCKTAWPNCLIEAPMDEQDAVNLMALENPLKTLALKWWFYSLGGKAEFHDFYRAERKAAGLGANNSGIAK